MGLRRETMIVRVEKELGGGRPWYTPVFLFDEASPVDAPRWERVSAARHENQLHILTMDLTVGETDTKLPARPFEAGLK